MKTHDAGRAFVHLIRIRPSTPPVHIGDTIEIEAPYRRSRSLIVRISWSRALVIGWWRDTSWDEEAALMAAVQAWGIDPYDESSDSPEVKAIIRANVAAATHDVDTEWHLIEVLGADA